MAMDWLGIGIDEPSEPRALSREELQAKLDQKEAELRKVKSNSHQQIDRHRNSQDLLLSQLSSSMNPDDDLLENFDWSKALGENKEKKPMSDEGKEITFKSKEDLNRWMDQRDQKKMEAARKAAEQAAEVQKQLIQKFVAEHPDLVPHQKLVGRLWDQSMRLNQNIDPIERFKGVVEESKFLIGEGYSAAPNPRPPHPSDRNPYMSPSPSSGGVVSRQTQGSPYEGGYDPVAHSEELKARQQATLDKLFT